MRLDHLLSKEFIVCVPAVVGQVCVVDVAECATAALFVFAGWRHTFKVMVAPSGWWCGWLSGVCACVVLGVGGYTKFA